MKQRIPSIMYHSIGVPDKQWHWNFLTCPFDVFEDQLKFLKKFNYNTIDFQQIYDYVCNDKILPENSVFLTFDDGYLDNYVFAYPLLRKYGMKGTIFVNPEFVDKGNRARDILDLKKDFHEQVRELEYKGFCNWEELRIMDSAGVMDVQSHALTHTWYPISGKILDFRHPKDEYIWMDWNKSPSKKPLLQYLPEDKSQLGYAVFEHEKALSSKRVWINEDFQNELNQYVMNNGGTDFFTRPEWKDDLNYQSSNLRERLEVILKEETDLQYQDRIRFELESSKEFLERNLRKEVKFLCWPGGSATKIGVKIADDLGYLMSTAARDLTTKQRKSIINSPDNPINRVTRFTAMIYSIKMGDHNYKEYKYSPGWFFILQLWRFQRKYLAQYWVRFLHSLIIRLKRQ